MQLNFFDHLFFFVIGIIFPIMSLLSNKKMVVEEEEIQLPELPPKKHLYYTNGLMLIIGGMIVLTLWNVSQRSFETLGFSQPIINKTVYILITTILLIYFIDSLYGYLNFGKEEEDQDLSHIMPNSWADFGHFIFLAFAAGIFEEIMFRGFLINYLYTMLEGNLYVSIIIVIIPSIIFSIGHLYQGWLSVVKIFAISTLFSLLYLTSKSLIIVMMIHVFVDIFSAFLLTIAQKKTKN